MSETLIAELIVYSHGHLPILYRISESIAILDLIVSFASVAAQEDFVQPSFSDTLALQKARHPILERNRKLDIVANDTFADESIRLQIISGPNMSGKTIYLDQIALIVVMAQIGSFVPCTFASVRITDKLLTRIGHDDGAVVFTN
jgi:DNA mismatch repair protein MSH4